MLVHMCARVCRHVAQKVVADKMPMVHQARAPASLRNMLARGPTGMSGWKGGASDHGPQAERKRGRGRGRKREREREQEGQERTSGGGLEGCVGFGGGLMPRKFQTYVFFHAVLSSPFLHVSLCVYSIYPDDNVVVYGSTQSNRFA